MTSIDLSPSNDAGQLINALDQALHEGRRDPRPQVEKLLNHHDFLVRMDAVALLTTEWRITEHRTTAREMILVDPHDLVRLHAVLGLEWITDKETQTEDAALPARVYNDRGENAEVSSVCFTFSAQLIWLAEPAT